MTEALDHPSVPEGSRELPRGVFVTVEVEDADAVRERARELGFEIASPLRDKPWGQRHFMTPDPNGLLVDVVKPIPPSAEFVREHGLA